LNGCLYLQEEIDSSSNHQHSQQSIEEAGLLATHILYDELGVLRTEEPVPIKQGGEDGEQAHHHKDSLYQIMHSHVLKGLVHAFQTDRTGTVFHFLDDDLHGIARQNFFH